MNLILATYKPAWITSNSFLGRLKKHYKEKKAGFSGTLDPFAKGCLVVAFGHYTKLLPYIKLSPKTYTATLWLGAKSESLDIESVQDISLTPALAEKNVKQVIESLIDIKEIVPPKFSAKRINGKRAYDLARNGVEFELKKISVEILSASLISYRHPFVTFKVTVSKGTYIRTLGEIAARKLGTYGCLSSLERISEGIFNPSNPQMDILQMLNLPQNRYLQSEEKVKNGHKLNVCDFENKATGDYLCVFESFYSIIKIDESGVSYLLNDIAKV